MITLKDITCLDTLGCASAILSELNGTRLALSFIMQLKKKRTAIREDSRSRYHRKMRYFTKNGWF